MNLFETGPTYAAYEHLINNIVNLSFSISFFLFFMNTPSNHYFISHQPTQIPKLIEVNNIQRHKRGFIATAGESVPTMSPATHTRME